MVQAEAEWRDNGVRPLRVVILGTYPITRQALSMVLADMPDVEIVGQGPVDLGPGDPVLALDPDLVVVGPVDGPLPQPLWPATRRDKGRPLIIALVAADDPERVLGVLRGGVHGVLRADLPCSELIKALSLIRLGYVCLPTYVLTAGLLVPDRVRQVLAPKELEVLRLMAEGRTNKEIARLLKISRKTVDTYRVRLQNKLGVSNRVEAVAIAIRRGLL